MLDYVINNIKKGQIARGTFHQERWYIIYSEGIRYCDMNGENISELVTLSRTNILAHYDLLEIKITMTDEHRKDMVNFVEKALIEIYKPPCAITSTMLTHEVEFMSEDELISETIRLSKVLKIMSKN